MALNAKPLPRRRTLPGLLAAVEQQPRLWLPLQLQADQFWVWSVPFVAVMPATTSPLITRLNVCRM